MKKQIFTQATSKHNLLVLFLILSTASLYSQAPFSVSTFHSLSLYWSPAGGDSTKQVLVNYRELGSTTWKTALPLKYNPVSPSVIFPQYFSSDSSLHTGTRYDKAAYRGSIVDLIPGVTYDIELTLETTAMTATIQASTWSENFTIAQTISPGNRTSQVFYQNLVGTPSGYILVDGTGDTIDIQDNSNVGIIIADCEYVIFRGFTIINAKSSGIKLISSHHVVIEDCDISAWGSEDVAGSGFGKGGQGAIISSVNGASSCVFQRNKIHHPSWDSNSWNEEHTPGDPNSKHPDGPQAIMLAHCYIGNNVIRYNEIWSDSAHYFNDGLGYYPNPSYDGFPGPDSDIYGNYVANCHDDGIESEGANTNVRIWGNYIEKVFMPMGNAPTSIGPLYVWKNVSGKTHYYPGAQYDDFGAFLKMGYASELGWMSGHMYIFNNTILQPNGQGAGGLGTMEGVGRYVRRCETRNNILHLARPTAINSISIRPAGHNIDNNFDYDLLSHPFPAGSELHGISGVPTYVSSSSFDFTTKTGNFQLDASSLGYDAGVVIPNFTDGYLGTAPDIGAHENGTSSIVYGVNADFTRTTGLEDQANVNPLSTIQAFPNPVREVLTISIPHSIRGKLNVKLISITGTIILEKEISKQKQSQINVSNIQAGLYLLELISQSGSRHFRSIVIE